MLRLVVRVSKQATKRATHKSGLFMQLCVGTSTRRLMSGRLVATSPNRCSSSARCPMGNARRLLAISALVVVAVVVVAQTDDVEVEVRCPDGVVALKGLCSSNSRRSCRRHNLECKSNSDCERYELSCLKFQVAAFCCEQIFGSRFGCTAADFRRPLSSRRANDFAA